MSICKQFNHVIFFVVFPVICLSATTINYDSTDIDVLNPERGMYVQRGSDSGLLGLTDLMSLKNDNISLVRMLYKIPVRFEPISASFLNRIGTDMETARTAGVKLIVRFYYLGNDDAPLQWILHHIGQVEPILKENYDVIALMEAGFIGAWGEWHSSVNNLDNPDSMRVVLYALLDALPPERTVGVRTPRYKRAVFNHDSAITYEEAFNGEFRTRTAHHNDCFLGSVDDYGTYTAGKMEEEKDYLNQECLYTPMQGETCDPSPYSGCENALLELARMRWTALNQDYHQTVLEGWESGGCMDEVKRRLGYRFGLKSAIVPDSVRQMGEFDLQLTIKNYGWATCYNARNLEVILRNKDTEKVYRLQSEVDPRFWQPGVVPNISIKGGIPQNMPDGNYEILLHLSDPIKSLHDRPEYAIHLANPNVWEPQTGYNSLLAEVVINANATGQDYNGQNFFTDEPYGGREFNINFKGEPLYGVQPLDVYFTDQTEVAQGDSILSWAWDFNNDSNTDSELQNPLWTFEQAGEFSVNLFIQTSDTCGSLLKSPYIVVYDSTASDIVIDGSFYDWVGIPRLDKSPDEEFAGDALNDHVDIVNMWTTHDEEKLYISYSCAGDITQQSYFYHVFIDSDNNPGSGFHSEGSHAGFEYMVENSILWKYTGTSGEWSWTNWGNIELQIGSSEASRLEMAVLRSKINNSGDNGEIDVVFNINNGDAIIDDYAPDAYQTKSYEHTFTPTGIAQKNQIAIPDTYKLYAYPNPFNSEIVIKYDSPCKCGKNLSAEIFDINGRLIKQFLGRELGESQIVWNGKDNQNKSTGSGIYFFRLNNDGINHTIKLTLIK